ncbi:MAG: DUF3405 domain-containing protein [Alphaproteobacteria bacterium]|nr:DUF3405 domain-containing protein [Alphaproteobacteria bacterium]
MRQADTVILVLSHVLNRGVVDLLNEIQAHCSGEYKVTLLFDNTKGTFDRRVKDTDCFLFDLQSIEDLRYPRQSFAYDDKRRQENPHHKDFNFVPGSIALPVLLFYQKYPSYQHYWVVEYDVRFTGRWNAFFSHFRDNPADLLGTTLTRQEDIPTWYHWPGLDLLDLPIDKRDYIRGFFPIYRISGRALAQLHAFYKRGVKGHFECLGPTLLRHAGLTIEDIGGAGEFVRPENVNRFYRNSAKAGALSPGTLVFRPVMDRPGKESGMLWHPVKYSPFWRILGRKAYRLARRVLRAIRGR